MSRSARWRNPNYELMLKSKSARAGLGKSIRELHAARSRPAGVEGSDACIQPHPLGALLTRSQGKAIKERR
jgi:hypothetical protein